MSAFSPVLAAPSQPSTWRRLVAAFRLLARRSVGRHAARKKFRFYFNLFFLLTAFVPSPTGTWGEVRSAFFTGSSSLFQSRMSLGGDFLLIAKGVMTPATLWTDVARGSGVLLLHVLLAYALARLMCLGARPAAAPDAPAQTPHRRRHRHLRRRMAEAREKVRRRRATAERRAPAHAAARA